jgi:protease-4
MSDEKKGFFRRLLPVWRGLDLFRRIILNVVFFVILILVLSLLLAPGPTVHDPTVLVVAPNGTIVEQLSPGGLQNTAKQMMGMGTGPETLLKDLLDAIDMAADDDRVKALLLNPDNLAGASLTKLQDLKAAVNRFKKSGKLVIAAADNYDRNSYYLAAQADEIYMHHMGLLILQGYGRYKRFYKEGLDRLEVDMNIFRVGKYKSAVEPFLRNNMSDEAKEANLRWLGVLWQSYLEDVAAARKIKMETLDEYIDQFTPRLKEFNGDLAEMALEAGLIDHVATRDQLRERLIQLVGEDKKKRSFYQIGCKAYLESLDIEDQRWGENEHGNVIGVVVAKGTILKGTQPPGTIGSDSTARLIRKAWKDKDVKAILLRVDSGGGSAFASEVIRRELEIARKHGKPVVVSMGSVAASGGYWISMASDEIWAYPTTITGSIGILGIFPTFQKPLAKYLGIRVDGVGTNKMAGALRPDRAMTPEVAEIIQTTINKGYNDFITRTAKARNMTPEQVHNIAQGRVWIGKDAHKLGLVDHLGDFDDALNSAAKLAKLGEDYKVEYLREKPCFQQRFISNLFSKETDSFAGTWTQGNQPLNPITNMLKLLAREIQVLSQFNDPNGVYAYWPYIVE